MAILTGIVLVLIGIGMLIGAAAAVGKRRTFAEAESVTGTIIGKRKWKRKNGTAYELILSYTVDGTEYHKTVGSVRSEYQAVAEGDPIALLVRPDKPKRVVRPETLEPKNVRILLLCGAAFIGIGIVLFLIGWLMKK